MKLEPGSYLGYRKKMLGWQECQSEYSQPNVYFYNGEIKQKIKL